MNDDDRTQAAFTLRRNGNRSLSWSITVPADGRDHTDELRKAKRQALELSTEIEEETRRET